MNWAWRAWEDPDCRRPMQWDQVEGNVTPGRTIRSWRACAPGCPPLRTGRFRSHAAMENGLYAFLRETDAQQLLCVVHTGLEPVNVRLELPRGMAGMAAVHDHYSGRSLAVTDGGGAGIAQGGRRLDFGSEMRYNSRRGMRAAGAPDKTGRQLSALSHMQRRSIPA